MHFTMEYMDLQRLAAVCGMKKYRARLRLGVGNTPCVMLRLQPKEDVLEQCSELIDALSGTAAPEQADAGKST